LPDGIVVDANVMNLFNQSLIKKEATGARTLVERIESTHGFVIDEGGQIEHQWLETCDKAYFGTWLVEGLKGGRIRKVVAVLEKQHRKKLRIDCGMPTKRAELTYVAVANSVDNLKYIVTEDIDFWEPSAKKADETRKQAIKTARSGCVSKYLQTLGIAVGTVAQGLSET
jgi:hypothetical protein